MKPREFVELARKHGVSVTRDTSIDDRPLFRLDREYGDLHLFLPVPDIEDPLPVDVVINYCRKLGLLVSEFGIRYHDL